MKKKKAKTNRPPLAVLKGISTENSGKTPRRGRIENLRPFLPGASGNAGGRPKTAALSQACRDKLADLVPDDPHGRTYAQCIADRLGELAVGGNISAAQELADRAEGRARQTLDATVIATSTHPHEGLPQAELDELQRKKEEVVYGKETAAELERIRQVAKLRAPRNGAGDAAKVLTQ